MPRKTFRSYIAVFHCKTTGFGRRAEGRQLHQKQLWVFSDSASGLECAITSGADSFLAGKLEGGVSCEDGGWSSQWCHLQQFQDMSPLWVQAACRWDTVPSAQPGKPAELAWRLLWGYQQGHHRYFYLSDPSSILMWGKKFDVSHCVILIPDTSSMVFPFPLHLHVPWGSHSLQFTSCSPWPHSPMCRTVSDWSLRSQQGTFY